MRRRRITQSSPYFFRKTVGLDEVEYLIMASLDRQFRAQVKKLPPELLGRGEKITVLGIKMPAKGGRGMFEITLKDGQTVPFYGELESADALTSGTTGNVAIDLRQLGVERVGVIGAVGDDVEGGQLLGDLKSRGINYGVVKSDATSVTLRVQEKGTNRIVLLCKKGKYNLGSEESAYIARVHPRVVAFTSLRPAHLSFALDVFRKLGQKKGNGRTLRALVPHPDLLVSDYLDTQITALAGLTDVLVMNRYEHSLAARLALNPLISAVTTDAEGARYRERGDGDVSQEAFPTKVEEPAGAGDAFLATLLAWEQQGKPLTGRRLELAVREACFVAAQKVGSHGPWAIPTLERIARFRKAGH